MLRARYDSNGNIVLSEAVKKVPVTIAKERPVTIHAEVKDAHIPEVRNEDVAGAQHSNHSSWTEIPDYQSTHTRKEKQTHQKHGKQQAETHFLTEEQVSTCGESKRIPSQNLDGTRVDTRSRTDLQNISHPKTSVITSALQEGKDQFTATVNDAKSGLQTAAQSIHQLPKRTGGTLKRLWQAANKPVMLPGKKGIRRKPPTKLSLFITDTIRFGGTFALIFGVLFVSINYQSFWQIARAQLALDADLTTEEALERMTQTDRPDTSVSAESVIDAPAAGLLAALPQVGPYEDRLIIPKLKKNVPIVRPGMDALMKEDWKQFELDIQTALKDGIVHYPGSAKPGQAGNFFLTGHSSYYPWDDGRFKNVFARLNELMPGDTYMVYYGGDRHTYRITKKEEVKPSNVTVLDQPTDRRLATLMTCTPVGTTLRRLVVIAEEIDPVTGEALKVGEKMTDRKENPFLKLGALPI
ncbi:MAG: class E sortase [Candidatus Peribacteraceae bacterium]|nr:class E sortase [Candidatus Peribacteraceae bacterium]